jgi:uncharacterized protein YjaZ
MENISEKVSPLDTAKVLQKLEQKQVKTAKSIIQAEGKAHMKEVKVSDKAYEQLKKKAEAEGKTPEEKAAEIVVQKSQAPTPKPEKKPKAEKQPKGVQYPVDVRVNAYGFLRLSKDLCEDLGWHWDMALKLVKNPDGSATLRKAV